MLQARICQVLSVFCRIHLSARVELLLAFALQRVLEPSALKRNVFQILLISAKRNLPRAIALKRDCAQA